MEAGLKGGWLEVHPQIPPKLTEDFTLERFFQGTGAGRSARALRLVVERLMKWAIGAPA